jgi:hypothetical protein
VPMTSTILVWTEPPVGSREPLWSWHRGNPWVVKSDTSNIQPLSVQGELRPRTSVKRRIIDCDFLSVSRNITGKEFGGNPKFHIFFLPSLRAGIARFLCFITTQKSVWSNLTGHVSTMRAEWRDTNLFFSVNRTTTTTWTQGHMTRGREKWQGRQTGVDLGEDSLPGQNLLEDSLPGENRSGGRSLDGRGE